MLLGGVTELIGDVGLKQATADVEKIIGESVQLSRSLSQALSPPILHECGLSGGLEWLVRWMRDKHNFKVDLSLETRPELPEDVRILVFESVRELLVNSVKHSKVRSTRVSLKRVKRAGLQIAVSDEGAGFDPCQLKPPGQEGGFGLFSVRERIGLIGGRFEVDSAPSKGSRFILTVPCSQTSSALLPADLTSPVSHVDSFKKETPSAHRTAIRVLLADDHAHFRDSVARILNQEPDFKVVGHATDGQEAIDLARKLKPDVILMDIIMPKVNGMEATRVIHREHPDICIIGLSMHQDEEHEQFMRDAGAVDYKNKEGDVSVLVSAIRCCAHRQ